MPPPERYFLTVHLKTNVMVLGIPWLPGSNFGQNTGFCD